MSASYPHLVLRVRTLAQCPGLAWSFLFQACLCLWAVLLSFILYLIFISCYKVWFIMLFLCCWVFFFVFLSPIGWKQFPLAFVIQPCSSLGQLLCTVSFWCKFFKGRDSMNILIIGLNACESFHILLVMIFYIQIIEFAVRL